MKKLLLLIIVSLSLAGVASAAHTWTDGDPGDSLWSTVGNWDQGTLPGTADWVKVRNGGPGVTIPSGVDALSLKTHVGYAEGGTLTVDGGTLQTVGDDLLLAKQGGDGILNMIEGTINVGKDLEVGQGDGDSGIINMTGGTIYVNDDFEIAQITGTTGEVYLDGGTIILTDAYEGDGHLRMYVGGSLDFGDGTLILPGDKISVVQGYIDSGWITGYGVVGNVTVTWDDVEDITTVTATADPLERYPAMDQWDVPRPVTLSWNNIESIPPGSPVWVDVWFGTDPSQDPNGVYADFTRIVDVGQDVNSVPVSTLTDTTEGFYWQVNTYVYGDPAHGQYNYGDDPNLAGEDIVKGLLMNFHTRNGPSCAGLADFNCSGVIALDDLSYIAGVWLTDDPIADIADPADNMVDVLDLSVVAQQWLDVSAEIAYWMLDETEGAVASDSSANDFYGTLKNMDDSDWVPGNTGNALDFDGVDDYVHVGNVFAELVGRDITISAWVKAPALNPASQFIISINTASGDNRLLCGTTANSATLSLGDTAWHHTTATVIDNTWHHIAYVIEESSRIITVYVDGSFATNFTSTISLAAGDVLSFGQEYDPGMVPGDFYSGQLDDVRVYDRVLSEAEIATLAQ